MSSAKEGAELEPAVEGLGIGVDDFLVKLGESPGLSPLPSDSDCGCDGELDLCEIDPTVEAGEGGARDSDGFPDPVFECLSSSGAFNNGIETFSFSFSLSLCLLPFRLYHLSFPTPLLFGDVGSTEGLPGIGVISDLLTWGDEALAGEGAPPEADEFVETIETASSTGFFSPAWLFILTEGTCRNEWNSPPCDFCGGCWGIGGGGGKSGGRLSFEWMGELLIFGEFVGFDGAGVVGPEDSAKSEESCSVVRPGGRVGI